VYSLIVQEQAGKNNENCIFWHISRGNAALMKMEQRRLLNDWLHDQTAVIKPDEGCMYLGYGRR
jgi:hypothetical protein